jgi:hypothetical protein
MALSKSLLATDGRRSRHNDYTAVANGIYISENQNCNFREYNLVMARPNQKRRSENIPVTIATMMQRIRFSFFSGPILLRCFFDEIKMG